MKTLIFGAAGRLGYELMRQGQALKLDILGADLPQTDITRMAQVTDVVIDYQPSLVINAAVYTKVDEAESEPESSDCQLQK
jgi:dTDP-4-dehydrorhamnose reductase